MPVIKLLNDFKKDSRCPEKYQVDFNIKDEIGNTPLHYATMTDNVKLVNLLLQECGATADLHNN